MTTATAFDLEAWEDHVTEIMAKVRDKNYWPPAVTWAEEVAFAARLQVSDQNRIEVLIGKEKMRRLESGPDRATRFADPGFQIVLVPSLPQEGQCIDELPPDRSLLTGPSVGCQDMPCSPHQSQSTHQGCVGAIPDQSESETLERLFPLFLRRLLEGRFSTLPVTSA